MKKYINFAKGFLTIVIASLLVAFMSTSALAADDEDDSHITNLRQVSATSSDFYIKWDSKDLKRFDVWLSTTSDGTYEKVTQDKYLTHYAPYDRIIEPGKSYYIKIQGYDSSDRTVEITKPFEVVTAYDKRPVVKQTAGTAGSISLKWNSVPGASGYKIYKYYGTKLLGTSEVKGTKADIKVSSGNVYNVAVAPFRTSNSKFTAYMKADSYNTPTVYSAPGKACNLGQPISWVPTQINLNWDPCKKDKCSVNSWKVELYSLDGKKLGTVSSTGNYCYIRSKKIIKAVYDRGLKYRVKGSRLVNNMLLTGEWSSFKIIIPQARISGSMVKVSSSSYKASWKPIKNASYYYVYTNRHNGKGKWNRVKVGGKQTSYVIKNIKKGQRIQVYVMPVVKVNGKYITGTKTVHSRLTITR